MHSPGRQPLRLRTPAPQGNGAHPPLFPCQPQGGHLKFTFLNRTFIVVHYIKLVKYNLCKNRNLVNFSKTNNQFPPFFLSFLDKIYKTGMAQGVHAYVL